MVRPPAPVAIPAMSVGLLVSPVFCAKKVSDVLANTAPAPTTPSGLEVFPPLEESAASRPAKFGSCWS